MTRRGQALWMMGAAAFTVINLGGGIYAVVMGDSPLHTGGHIVLTFVGAYAFWRLATKWFAESGWRSGGSTTNALRAAAPDRLDNLQNAIDAVAVEVERIGEGQRFLDRLVANEDAAQSAIDGAAAPVANKGPAAPPNVRRD